MILKYFIIFTGFYLIQLSVFAQQITGYWKGKIGSGLKTKKLELKLVIKGDSIVGTSYYFESKNNFRRYSVKGYFNPKTNAVIWWDDILLSSKQPRLKILSPGELPYIAEADFNCPGGGTMMLDGKATPLAKETGAGEKIHLDKTKSPVFDDEWNLVIDNWMDGGNDLALIDSIQHIAFQKPEFEVSKPLSETPGNNTITSESPKLPVVELELPVKKEKTIPADTLTKPAEKENKPIEFIDLTKPGRKETVAVKVSDTVQLQPTELPNPVRFEQIEKPQKEMPAPDTIERPITVAKKELPAPETPAVTVPKPLTEPIVKAIETKYKVRTKEVLTEIPIETDSIELHFYDNAQVDGDSISLFLNDVLLLEHIRLTDKPFIVKLNKEQLATARELTMVAENLGSIPPNTSYMVAYVNGKKYDATLSSTEQSSAVIRFKRGQ